MLKNLYWKIKNRTKYSFADMPKVFHAFFALIGFIISGYIAYVLKEAIPSYIEIANSIPLDSWGLKGWVATALLLFIMLNAWFFFNLGKRSSSILCDWVFK